MRASRWLWPVAVGWAPALPRVASLIGLAAVLSTVVAAATGGHD